MSDLKVLLSLVPNSPEFEAERSRLIREQIQEAPAHLRPKLTALQASLDIDRQVMTPEEFMTRIAQAMNENMENLEDLVVALDHAVNGKSR